MLRGVMLTVLLCCPWAAAEDWQRVRDVRAQEVVLDDGTVLRVDDEVDVFRDGAWAAFEALEEGDVVCTRKDRDGQLVRVEAVSSEEQDRDGLYKY